MKISSQLLLILSFFFLFSFCSRNIEQTAKRGLTIPKIDTLPLFDDIKKDTLEDPGYYQPQFLRYHNFTYSNDIATVTFHKEGLLLSDPVLGLTRNEYLQLEFDDLDKNLKNYSYTLIHCTSDWQPSEIQSFEYIEGFEENRINDYRFSFNTIQSYIHYTLLIPNEDITITKSGNYLLKVFLEDDPEQLIITRRFMVVAPKAAIDAHVKRPDIVKYSQTHQQINFTIDHTGIVVSNPFEELTVVVMQNGRWDNAIRNLKPKFVQNNLLTFHDPNLLLFNAGKEFRRFDMRSFRYLSEYLLRFESKINTNHIYLKTDEVRSYKKYFYNADMNGKFFIEITEGKENEIEADYALVHFKLPFDSPLTLGNLYLFGAMTDWNILEKYRMEYNYELKCYEAKVLLKQGYYNYQYVFLEDGSDVYDNSLIEGNYFEAENNYTILTYYRPFGGRYDELIGVETINSIKP